MDFYLALAPEALPSPYGRAWLFCPFTKMSPDYFPENVLPVLTDSTPYGNQNPEAIAELLLPLVQNVKGVVLDFQRKHQPGLQDFVEKLRACLPCPVAVPPEYAGDSGPVFLPPIPPEEAPESWLTPWKKREIWLDFAPLAKTLILTPAGCTAQDGTQVSAPEFRDAALFCHYTVAVESPERVSFSLWRTEEDLKSLVSRLESWGVHSLLGLYPELTTCGFLPAPFSPGSDR